MRPTEDLCGKRFGRVTVAAPVAGTGRARFSCRCDCGTVFAVLAQALKSGNTRSCGCLYRESRGALGKSRHGMTGTRTHAAWLEMRRRCCNPRSQAWPNYGGRGIVACAHWQTFENFLADMGECPIGMEIDRQNVNGNYEPGNCRWATLVEQANNKRNNRMVDGLTVAQVADRDGIKYSTAYYRHVVRGHALARDHLVQMEHPEQLTWE